MLILDSVFLKYAVALALAVGSVPFLLRILRTAWRGSTAKEELCRKILGDGAPSAALPPQAGGICMLYDAGKFAEGMSVERIAQCMAEGMALLPNRNLRAKNQD